MMNSSFDNDEDEFGPNPFRTSSAGGPDFFGAPPSVVQQPSTESMMMYGHQPPMMQQPQPSYPMPQQQQQQQQPYYNQQQQQPDPNSGMTGTWIPAQQPSPVGSMSSTTDPSQYLTGTMDQKAPTNTNRNYPTATSPNNNYGATQDSSYSASIFSWRNLTNCCRFNNFANYFDVDSIDIYVRLKASATQFWRPDYFRMSIVGDVQIQQAANNGIIDPNQVTNVPIEDRKGPDLYGPFWIAMTLIFCLGVTANLSSYMHHQRRTPDETFEYDIHHLIRAGWVVGIFGFAVPTAFWLACQCMGMPGIAWVMWICCYGYALTPILLGSLLAWILPYELWHLIIIALATAASGLLVIRNLSTPLLSQDSAANHAKAAPVLLAILGVHVCYFLVLKITFYK